MATDPAHEIAARAAAEEVLQAVYGDDLSGCSVRIDTIVGIIAGAIGKIHESEAELIALYEAAFEALRLLSTPPIHADGLDPNSLRVLLSERLDQIQELSKKLISTAAAVRSQHSVVEPSP